MTIHLPPFLELLGIVGGALIAATVVCWISGVIAFFCMDSGPDWLVVLPYFATPVAFVVTAYFLSKLT